MANENQKQIYLDAPKEIDDLNTDHAIEPDEKILSKNNLHHWTIEHANNTYGISKWGRGFFKVGTDGSILVTPGGDNDIGISLSHLSEKLTAQGLQFPMVVRFPQILRKRAAELVEAFKNAREKNCYGAEYKAIYPIKVNQNESVVRTLASLPTSEMGLEVGSRAELVCALSIAKPGATIVCNGYKDSDFIELALQGQKIGYQVFIVVEKECEIDSIIAESRRIGVEPLIGLRVRLAAMVSGKWEGTGGERSKFGLTASQLLSVASRLDAAGMQQCVRLLHFHVGSQISNLNDFDTGIAEALGYFGALKSKGLRIDHLDVGGGLGVDYDGSNSASHSSINYLASDYAFKIIKSIKDFCSSHSIELPIVFSESGRFLTAHHAVFLTNVIGTESRISERIISPCKKDEPEIIKNLRKIRDKAQNATLTEALFMSGVYFSEIAAEFADEKISIEDRAIAEDIYFELCNRYRKLNSTHINRSSENLHEANYTCNFSVFQALPDTWAIDQILPVAPIQRLDEKPNRNGIIQDLTCDSDGMIKQYCDGRREVKSRMPLHNVEISSDERYVIGFFMVGAYQEILGSKHNLFGDVNCAVVSSDGGNFTIEIERSHDNVADVLKGVGYNTTELSAKFKRKVEGSALDKESKSACVRVMSDAMNGFTYFGQALRQDPAKKLAPEKTRTERVVQAIGFEVFAFLFCTPIFSLIMSTPMLEMGGLVIINSAVALIWNCSFNTAYDHFERLFFTERNTLGRILHAILFEVGLAIFTIPICAIYLDISMVEAFLLDFGFLIFYMPYTYAYHWAYDTIRMIVFRKMHITPGSPHLEPVQKFNGAIS